MCVRYYVEEDTAKAIQKVIRDLDRKLALETGDVHPSEQAVVLTGKVNNRKWQRAVFFDICPFLK